MGMTERANTKAILKLSLGKENVLNAENLTLKKLLEITASILNFLRKSIESEWLLTERLSITGN